MNERIGSCKSCNLNRFAMIAVNIKFLEIFLDYNVFSLVFYTFLHLEMF